MQKLPTTKITQVFPAISRKLTEGKLLPSKENKGDANVTF